jgi:hypothetical protein
MRSALVSGATTARDQAGSSGAPSAGWVALASAWLAGSGGASLLLATVVAAALAWLVLDAGPRFNSAPLRLPLQHTIWDSYGKPRSSPIEPGPPVELGVVFRPAVAGRIVGLRYYKVAGDSGPHVGSLWSAKGKQLATVTFADEATSGWQEALFTTPVRVSAGRLLVASYFAPVGGQMVLETPRPGSGAAAKSASPAFQRPPVKERPTSVYHLGGPGFPSTDAGGRSIWVDVVFVPDGAD